MSGNGARRGLVIQQERAARGALAQAFGGSCYRADTSEFGFVPVRTRAWRLVDSVNSLPAEREVAVLEQLA